jgi:phospholipid transport system substrate-binding protein
MRLGSIILGLVVFLCPAALAKTGDPTRALQGPMNQMISLLNDKQYKETDGKTKQRDKMWELVHQIFDFSEISKRSLAANWKRFTEPQKETFKEAFTRLLGDTYLNRIQGEYTNERVEFIHEKLISGKKAVVKTKIIGTEREIPIQYSMYLTGGSWRVYDVNIEGVSLVQNYRRQFQEILLKNSPDDLIKQIQNKVIKKEKTPGKRKISNPFTRRTA